MRTKLGRAATVVSFGLAVVMTGSLDTVVRAQEPAPPSTVASSNAPTVAPPPAPAAQSAAPPTTAPPGAVDEPAIATEGMTPSRGSQAQETDTIPPPPPPPPPPAPDELPANSGSGRRVVYSKSRQRVWTVEADGSVSKTHRVSGRLTWNQPSPGTYDVFSRSSYTCNIKNPDICWRYMVRFTKGPDGDNIGFHEIPKRNGVPVQSESQLGQPLSGGCVRQATPDAVYMWNWAWIGTKVVVLG
jgi:lipoprotein-anchoring transpeptidase ErfK/SrfK